MYFNKKDDKQKLIIIYHNNNRYTELAINILNERGFKNLWMIEGGLDKLIKKRVILVDKINKNLISRNDNNLINNKKPKKINKDLFLKPNELNPQEYVN